MKRFYTAESVTEGHPDKLCDLIADSVLDDCLKGDSDSRVACEVLATKGRIIVAGEITSRRNPDVSEIVKEVLEDVGYSPEGIQIDVCLRRQSPDIAEAVAHSMAQRAGLFEEQDQRNEGAGDQGVMVGFACRETPSLMPMPVVLANRIVRELSACRQCFCRPFCHSAGTKICHQHFTHSNLLFYFISFSHIRITSTSASSASVSNSFIFFDYLLTIHAFPLHLPVCSVPSPLLRHAAHKVLPDMRFHPPSASVPLPLQHLQHGGISLLPLPEKSLS